MKFIVTEGEMDLLVSESDGDQKKLQYLEENFQTYQSLKPLVEVWPSTIELMYQTSIALKQTRGWLLS